MDITIPLNTSSGSIHMENSMIFLTEALNTDLILSHLNKLHH